MYRSTKQLLAILGVLSLACARPYPTSESAEIAIKSPSAFPQGWLKKKITVQTAEQANLRYSFRDPKNPVPFGNISMDWAEFKIQICSDCEIWYWESPKYEPFFGVFKTFTGYCIIQHGKIIAIFQNGFKLQWSEN